MSLIPTAWIPYPGPPPSVELRSGILYSGCQCVKRDGLQQDCPRTGCQGRAPCMAFPAPECVPSGNAPPPPLPRMQGYMEPSQYQSPPAPPAKPRSRSAYPRSSNTDEKYVRMGRQGYLESPPARNRRVPCQEHRKTRM